MCQTREQTETEVRMPGRVDDRNDKFAEWLTDCLFD